MSEQNLKATYGGVDITYDELTNKWNFELRGRERNTDSLALAKEAIDKPEPKKKTFERIPAFMLSSHYNTRGVYAFIAVEVTSVADLPTWGGGRQLWVVGPDGKRSKESSARVYAATPDNKLRMAKYITDQKEIEKLRDQLEKTLKGIALVEVPSE